MLESARRIIQPAPQSPSVTSEPVDVQTNSLGLVGYDSLPIPKNLPEGCPEDLPIELQQQLYEATLENIPEKKY